MAPLMFLLRSIERIDPVRTSPWRRGSHEHKMNGQECVRYTEGERGDDNRSIPLYSVATLPFDGPRRVDAYFLERRTVSGQIDHTSAIGDLRTAEQ